MNSDLSGRVGAAAERLVPGDERGRLVVAEHLLRYRWASALAAGRRVLDAGCGAGYGTALLADAGAGDAVGIDIAADVVRAAADAYPAASFVQGDVRQLPFGGDRFELVACFEVIEHVADQAAVLDEIARVLAPGGVLAISSPHRGVYPAGNPHHVHELTPAELDAVLLERFAHVALWRQHAVVASVVLDGSASGEPDLPARGVVELEPGSEPYVLALASDAPLPAVGPRAALGGPEELVAVQGAAQLAIERDRARQEAAELRDIEARLRRESATLLAELEAERATIASIRASASWRLTEPLRRARPRPPADRG